MFTKDTSNQTLMKLRSLTDDERHLVICRIHQLLTNYRLRPVIFSLRASVLTFIILAHLPAHPMSISIALGGGISIALLTY